MGSKIQYTNRYGDTFTFTEDKDGNVLWEGSFEYIRYGFPNDYTQALFEYIKDTGGGISLSQFKELVHAYDEEKEEYVIDRKYRELITSNTAVVNMVDPSGGPFIVEGMDMGLFSAVFKKKRVVRFESIEKGYKIICKDIKQETNEVHQTVF
jgi:hypothetical protein